MIDRANELLIEDEKPRYNLHSKHVNHFLHLIFFFRKSTALKRHEYISLYINNVNRKLEIG